MSGTGIAYWKRVLVTAAIYIAAAWAAVEALLTVVDRFGLPAWWGTLIAALFVAGLPVTVYLVWRTAGVERKASAASIVGSMLFLIIATAALFWFTRPPPLPVASAVAIVPCDYEGEGEYAYRAQGLAEDVHARLSRVDAVRISSWNSSLFVQEKGYEPALIAEVLNVDRLVQCRMKSDSGRIELSARVIDPAADKVLWNQNYDFTTADLGTVVQELTGALLNVLGTTTEAAEMERVNGLGTFSPEAYDLFLQARAADGPDISESLIRQALEIDPNYAEALVLHSDIYLMRAVDEEFEDMQGPLKQIRESRALARRALELDPGVLGARNQLSIVCGLLRDYFDEDCTQEEQDRLLEEECEVRGGTAEGWACWHVVLAGRNEDNSHALEQWLELEPTSMEGNMQLMGQLNFSGADFAEVLAVFETLRALEPDDPRPYGMISNMLRGKGRLDEVVAWRFGAFGDQRPEGPWRLARLATDYMNLGLYEPALELGLQTWETRRASATHFLPLLWVRSGEPERAAQAVEWMAQSIEDASGSPESMVDLAAFHVVTLRNYERARELYKQALAGHELGELCGQAADCMIYHALNLAHAERSMGQAPKADEWLEAAEEALGKLPPDASLGSLRPKLLIAQDRNDEAIKLLREGVFEWRGDEDLELPIYLLESDALFDPLSNTPGFKQLLEDYHAHLEPMSRRVLEAGKSGDWEALRQRTFQWARGEGG
jgi:TolB-like protein